MPTIVSDEYKKEFLNAVAYECEVINNALNQGRKVAKKDLLWREYATTLLDNPTDGNIALMMCGREYLNRK